MRTDVEKSSPPTRQFLQLLVQPDEVTELFVKYAREPGLTCRVSWTGYYDSEHFDQLIDDASPFSGKAIGIYFRINPVMPAALARSTNRLQPARYVASSTSAEIVRRRVLFVDIDPVLLMKGTSATADEKTCALYTAKKIRAFLCARNWPDPVVVDSGNGFYLLYRVDLPSDDGGLVKRDLVALSVRFTDEHAKVDTTVHDAARLARLPGTLNCKGDDTPDRPHRMCRVCQLPQGDWQSVPQQLLKELAAEAPSSSHHHRAAAVADHGPADRGTKYVSKMPPAISGQHGHDQTFKVACCLIQRFGMSQEQAWPILQEYNQRCQPPWSDEDLRRKLAQAELTAAGHRSAGQQRTKEKVHLSEYDAWEPLAGPEFPGWIPDFGDCEKAGVWMSLDRFRSLDWSYWFDVFSSWKLLASHPFIPDVFLAQLRWGGTRPKNWRRDLKLMRGQSLLAVPYRPFRCAKELCLLSGLGIRHEHFPTIIQTRGFLHETLQWKSDVDDSVNNDVNVPKSPPADAANLYPPPYSRHYRLYDPEFRPQLQKARQLGQIFSIYWPALLLSVSPKIGWTKSMRRMLVAVVREITRGEGKDNGPEIIRDGKVSAAGRGEQTVVCPLLDPDREYVVFGGNKRLRGRGYQIIGRTYFGWLWRAGYWRTHETVSADVDEMMRSFLRDLAHLARDLDLVIAGYHPRHPFHQWRGIDDLQNCLRTRAGREWLSECTLRIYAPADYLIRWRYFFSKRLGFRWIPRSVDDPGPKRDVIVPADDSIRTGHEVRELLGRFGWSQSQLAEMLSFCLERPVSRQRISRVIEGRVHPEDVFFWINKLRSEAEASL